MAKIAWQDPGRIYLDLVDPQQRPAIDAFSALIEAVPALFTGGGFRQRGGRNGIYVHLVEWPLLKPVLNCTMPDSRAQLEFRRSQFLGEDVRLQTVEQAGANRYVPFDVSEWQRWIPVVTAYAQRINSIELRQSSGHQLMANILHHCQPNEWLDEVLPENVRLNFKYRPDFYNEKRGVVIEVDGKQHHQPIKMFGGIDAYRKLQRRDEMMNDAVIAAGLRMIRVKAYGRRAALTSLSREAFWTLLNERLKQGDPDKPVFIDDAP